MTPPFFGQEGRYTCSLAALRMVLTFFGITVSEAVLLKQIHQDYSPHFKNIWNPSIAKLASQYGLATTLTAAWPLLKSEIFKQARAAYLADPTTFDIRFYEPDAQRHTSEPLPIAYQDLFEAVGLGCQIRFGRIDQKTIQMTIEQQGLIQTSVRLHKLYPGSQRAYHSIVIYKIDDDIVTFHDPARGPAHQCTVDHLLAAADKVGAFMSYSGILIK